jgi:hypothetical protein
VEDDAANPVETRPDLTATTWVGGGRGATIGPHTAGVHGGLRVGEVGSNDRGDGTPAIEGVHGGGDARGGRHGGDGKGGGGAGAGGGIAPGPELSDVLPPLLFTYRRLVQK